MRVTPSIFVPGCRLQSVALDRAGMTVFYAEARVRSAVKKEQPEVADARRRCGSRRSGEAEA
jgi:hypothetical protein